MEGLPDVLADGICSYDAFVAVHKDQLISSGVPTIFWEAVHQKLQRGIFDAGDFFKIIQVQETSEDEENDGAGPSSEPPHSWKVIVDAENGIDCADPMQIFLVDHAWTYRVSDARAQLREIPNLLDRMVALMDVDVPEGQEQSTTVERVLSEMWRYNATYSVQSPGLDIESAMPIWYVMDEFGSRIQHSDEPTFRTVPFFHSFSQTSFTLLFPIRSLSCGDDVTRNFVEGPVSDDLMRKALKLPWEPCDLTDVTYVQSEPAEDFYTSYRNNENFFVEDSSEQDSSPSCLPSDRKLRVFTQYAPVAANLKHPRFEIVSEGEEEADILWLTQHFKDYKGLRDISPQTFINQFPFEVVVTIKDLLCIVCRRTAKGDTDPETLETQPKWLPTTYNMKTELPQFVSYFQQREKKGLDNHWICKPWNLARGLDHHITNNLNYILRLPATGPKVACKYVEDPVLFHREEIGGAVKFDIRYIVLLRSAKPLKLFAYRRFWLRFANRPFSLDELDDYEKHFTVMNYRDTNLRQMFCHDFIESFESQYPEIKYEEVERDIFKMLKEVFEGATSADPPRGIAPTRQSRAMYGVDLMLKWDRQPDGTRRVQPMLLEINWTPDCTRACQYYPEFFDDVFSALFLDETEGRNCAPL